MPRYRQSPFANITPVVKNLLIINFIFFLAMLIFDHGADNGPMSNALGVYYFNSPQFKPWQIITYMFMHANFEHILFNMLGLFIFGPILEYAIGPKRFFNLYFICGIGAVLFQWLIQAIEVHQLTGSFIVSNPSDVAFLNDIAYEKLQVIYTGSLVGASGAIYGVLVAFAMLYPDMEMLILFIPVPVKAKYLIPVYIILEIWQSIDPGPKDNVAHVAHLGGALFAFILIKAWRYR